ncbi:MAG: major capsid protein [Alphaproteobacteria bacterium]|nr:major capsid protein [Alphaproteobacteria bacterium]MBF0392296.1 major capsid protein [Alphaproteobacteria bacterium]
MPMTTSQARVVDPVLTNHAQGYRQPEFVGSVLFPRVDVLVRGGKVVEFGTEAFRRFNARRAPGADVRVISLGYEGKPYELVQDTLDAKVPREHLEDAAQVPGLDLGMRATSVVMRSLALGLEFEQAALATDPANFPNSHKVAPAGAEKWTDPDSDPIAMVEAGKAAVRGSTGVYPNAMVLGPPAYEAIKIHPKVLERFKGITADSVTPEMLARLFDLKKVAVGLAVEAAEAGGFSDVWGPHAVLGYAPDAPTGQEEPSFAYTYTLKGHPFVEAPYWNQDKRSWLYGVTYERRPVLTGITAGYLIQGAA